MGNLRKEAKGEKKWITRKQALTLRPDINP